MTDARLPGWRDLPRGGDLIEAGSSVKQKTGAWRTYRPVWDGEKCIHCLRCWILCPDSAVVVKDQKYDHVNLDYCKGCGICANDCPVDALAMKLEREFED